MRLGSDHHYLDILLGTASSSLASDQYPEIPSMDYLAKPAKTLQLDTPVIVQVTGYQESHFDLTCT